MICGVGAVLDQDLEGVEQHAAERRVLRHHGALIDVLEAVGLADAGQFELAVGLLTRNRSAEPARRRTRRSASSERPGSSSAGR